MPGVVGVQALHALARAAHTTRRPRAAVVGRQQGVALGRVTSVGGGQLLGVDGGLGRLHSARRFEPTDGFALGLAHQPVEGGHGGGVGQQRPVADDDGIARLVAHHDVVSPARLTAEQRDHSTVLVRAHPRRRRLRRRRVKTHSRNSTAPTGAPTRFATDPPAVPSRSTGWAGADSMRRTCPLSEGAGASCTSTAGAAGVHAGSSVGAGVGAGSSPRSTSSSSRSTNCPSSLALTSASTPRPNCATLPVTARSVTTATRVPSPSGCSDAVMVALALPWPRVSRPSARSTARWAASSRSTNVAVPLYCAVIGPTLTFTTPRYSSPSTSCSSAPGMHGAMRSTSVSTAHARSTGTLTRNSLVSSISSTPWPAGPPACRRPPPYLRTLLRSRGRAAPA